MSQQLFLFEMPKPTIQDVLLAMAEHGSVFYSVSDVARLSGYSGYQVYWAIWYCRLDAISVCGQWRIPYTAILEWIEQKEQLEQQYENYRLLMKEREVPGFWKARKLIKSGYSSAAVKAFLAEKGLVATDYLIGLISKHSFIDRTADIEEEGDLFDWYDLHRLQLPAIARMSTWASILRVPEDSLAAEPRWNGMSDISNEMMLEFLIEREIANIPVFSSKMFQMTPPPDDDFGQLPLPFGDSDS